MKPTSNRNHTKGRNMATKTKVKSGLEIAKEEQVELQSRLGRAKDTHDHIEIELKELQARRLDPSALEDRNAQQRSIQLKAMLADESDAIASLEHAIRERSTQVDQLEHATAKEGVAAECRALEQAFYAVIDLLEGHTTEMQAWIAAASTAHGKFSSINKTQNMTLTNKMRMMGHLMDQVKSARGQV